MKKIELIRKLSELDRRGVHIVARRDIEKMFPDKTEKAMEKSLQRMVADGLLQRVARGLYLNPAATSKNRRVAEEIAKALRPGCLSCVSLESILSEHGAISQIPVNRMTVMTTGTSGVVDTPFGTIEFTHTKRGGAQIIKRTTLSKGRPLRIATKQTAIRDLLRVGRNAIMIDRSELEDESQAEDA